MQSEVYLFGDLSSGYTQYPDDYSKSIFQEFSKVSKSRTQLLIHRNENTVYYAYMRRLQGKHYFGIYIVMSGMLITNYKQLFTIFEEVVSWTVTRGGILEFSDNGDVKSSLDQFYNHKAESYEVAGFLKAKIAQLADSDWADLPPVDYAISTNEKKTFAVADNGNDISGAIGIYPYVFIVKDQNFDTTAVRSYSSILKQKSAEIASLREGNRELVRKNTALVNKQRNTIWVGMLGVLSAILFTIIYFKVINPSEVTRYDAGEFVYYGPISQGKPNGIGVAIYHDNDADDRKYYYGNFDYGQRSDSNAIMFYNDGSYFYGEMNDDKWIKGIFFDVQKQHFVGSFDSNNAALHGTWYKHVPVQSL